MKRILRGIKKGMSVKSTKRGSMPAEGRALLNTLAPSQYVAVVLCSCLFGAFTSYGFALMRYDSISLTDAGLYLGWLFAWALFALIFILLLCWRQQHTVRLVEWSVQVRRRWLLCIGAAIAAAWLLSLLGAWPGYYIDDQGGYAAFLETGYLSTQQSVFHTLFQTMLLRLGLIVFSSFNWAAAFSVIVQLGICLVITLICINIFMREGMPKRGVIAAAVFFALNPYIAMLVVSTVKDVLFCFYVMALLILLCHVLRKGNVTWLNMLSMAFLTFLILVYRNNAFPALLVFLPCIGFFALRHVAKKIKVRAVAPMLVGIAFYLMFTGPICSALHVDRPSSTREMISIPCMEIARVCTESEELCEAVSAAGVDVQQVIANYEALSSNSDTVRVLFWDLLDREGLDSILQLWLDARTIDFGACVEADMLLTEASWSPFGVMDGYQGMYDTSTPSYGFSPTAQEPAVLSSKLPIIHDFFQRLARYNTPSETGLLFPIVSVFPYVWMVIAACFLAIADRNREGVVVSFFALLIVMTNWLGPLVVMRYYLHLVLLVPAFCWYCFARLPKQDRQDYKKASGSKPTTEALGVQ